MVSLFVVVALARRGTSGPAEAANTTLVFSLGSGDNGAGATKPPLRSRVERVK